MTTQNPTGWDIPKRYLRVCINRISPDNKRDRTLIYQLTEDMRVKFNTVAACSGALTECNCVITGLDVATMFTISTSATQWMKNWFQHEIVIDAGFYGNFSILFRGTIINATASLDNADYTLTIKAMSGFGAATTPLSYSIEGKVPVSHIVHVWADHFNLGFVDGLHDDTIKIENFQIQEQNLTTAMRQISQMVPVDVYESNGQLIIKRVMEPAKGASLLNITSDMLVGAPQPTDTGCKVKVLMRHGCQTAQPVKLYSKKYPKFESTDFYIQTIAHSGDTFGSDWFTELELVKVGLRYYK
ncbi:MAG: hypothetical protein NC548_55340 [Lachnospiraceae bacterium]|nr:hypothetical protein [Lachnospiraceae bacterium]